MTILRPVVSPVVSPIVSPLGSFLYYATSFNQVDTYFNRGADLTGAVNGKLGIFSCWLKLDSATSAGEYIWDSGVNRFMVQWLVTEVFTIQARNAANAIILRLDSSTTYTNADGWLHLLGSWNLGVAGAGRLLVNGVDDKTETTYTDDTIDYTRTDHAIGATVSGASFFGACMSELYINMAEYMDFDVAANVLKFRTNAGKPADLGTDGSRPTGTAPIVYMRNPATAFEVNSGTGGDFTRNGTIAACADKP